MRMTTLRLALGATVFACGLAGCADQQIRLADAPSSELCVELADTVLTGQPYQADAFHPVQQSALVNELRSRGEKCDPWSNNLNLAYSRLQLQLQREQQAWAGMAQGAALMQASRPVVVPSPLHNTTTTCGWNGPQWQCNSMGN